MTEKRIRLLSLTNCILEYRIPVYNKLADYFDVTVAHYGNPIDTQKARFSQIILNPRNFGPIILFKENIRELASQFDSVLSFDDLHVWPFLLLPFHHRRRFSFTFWSMGVSASYTKRFDEDHTLDRFRFFLLNRADSIVFYSDYPIERYINEGGVSRSKLFVANNTVEVDHRIEIPASKKHFIFVGTLYRVKKIFELLEAYLLAFKKKPSLPPLILIGDGEERENIEKWIELNNLHEKILLKGSIFDQKTLQEYYTDSIACISPGQAGLSVLNSMAYGVPFITSEKAFTGCEILNISNGINGLLYQEGAKELSKILLDLSDNPGKVMTLGINSQEYYFKNRTIDMMVNGIKDAVLFAYESRRKLKF